MLSFFFSDVLSNADLTLLTEVSIRGLPKFPPSDFVLRIRIYARTTVAQAPVQTSNDNHPIVRL